MSKVNKNIDIYSDIIYQISKYEKMFSGEKLMNYGVNLKKIRERIGLTLVATAKLINVSDTLYSRYEKEKQTIPLKHLITLCHYFNVSLDYIFDFTTVKKYSKEFHKELASSRLKELRLENDLTQIEMADFLKIDQPTWSIYENGKSLIGTPFLYMLCKNYKLSADYLLGFTNKPKYLK